MTYIRNIDITFDSYTYNVVYLHIDFNHIIMNCPSLVSPRRNLFQFLFLNISPIDSHNILDSHSTHVILAVLKFIKATGYSI